MKDFIIILDSIIICVLVWCLYLATKGRQYWRSTALKNSRASFDKSRQLREMDGAINKKAADIIHRQNAVIEELQAENRKLKRINEQYKKQLERRNE